ncbi:amino acid/polyamine/organocation transporter, APC superfamily [Herbiconiux ginsengi]|uniref:Amino acid/polyamine/organocation transporter, APC superfamily n=1 Tax=Herbiconiux ginsengi TaxID=381665 RepID=A0A1H3TZP2_9MICO|nr:amino acid/polyamine/organocation transporter, APC superfamily [Herbiconiux ginsengi]
MLAQTGGLVSRGGSFAYFDLLLTATIVVMVALSIAIFGRRISAAGGVYTFVTRGAGPLLGIAAGSAIALGYGGMAVDTLLSGVRRIVALLFFGEFGERASAQLLTVILLVVVVAVITLVIALGARTSTRIMLAIEVVAVAAILTVSVIVFARAGWNVSGLVPDLAAAPSLGSFAAGIGLAMTGFVGFESGAALGPESRRPLASVPRALGWTAGALAAVYLFGVAAQLSAAPTSPGGATNTLLASTEFAQTAPWIAPAIEGVIAASWIVCALACTNALVRLVFSLAREGVLPPALSGTSLRSATPHRAAIAVGAVILVATLLREVTGWDSLFARVLTLSSSMGFIVAYLLVSVGAVAYLIRLREFSSREAWPAVLAAVALVGVILAEVLSADDGRRTALMVFTTILIAACVVHMVRVRRDPALRARLGVYDTPIASDALDGLREEEAARSGDGRPTR